MLLERVNPTLEDEQTVMMKAFLAPKRDTVSNICFGGNEQGVDRRLL